ncbi:MAG: hypothetical protein DHS20C01_13700 [marine bacterium B5-7]|nr:MAG: hypothetical protein DHS20C01_13700 [marine bacterium B5-7]
MRKLLLTGIYTLLLVGCATVPPEGASAGASVDEVLAMADQKLSEAKAAKAEWMIIDSATGSKAVSLTKVLAAAKEKAAAGETDEAMRMANRVIESSELGIEQVMSQKDAAPSFN